MTLDSLFAQFLLEKRYVTGCTEKTLTNFRESYNALTRALGELPFCNSYGGPLIYNNVRRDFQNFVRKLGIEGYGGSFHALRRFFATNFIKQGGNPLVLQRLSGHTTLQMTNKYVVLDNADLAQLQNRVSVLSRRR